MKLLLISNSTNPGENFLEYPKQQIKSFLGQEKRNVLFIPFAAVTFSYDEYEAKVKERFEEIGNTLVSVHHFTSPVDAVLSAEAIVVGGGNTFQLLSLLYKYDLVEAIAGRVKGGMPYIGWSAGANIASPTIGTTNDMPIVEPKCLNSFGFIPFQINPHYTDAVISGHGGETRDQRIAEYLFANKDKIVMGLPEGCMLKIEQDNLSFAGDKKARVFEFGKEPYEMGASDDFGFLIRR